MVMGDGLNKAKASATLHVRKHSASEFKGSRAFRGETAQSTRRVPVECPAARPHRAQDSDAIRIAAVAR